MPKMKHPDASRSIEVAPEQVGMYASQGWEEESKSSAKKTTTQKTSAAEQSADK